MRTHAQLSYASRGLGAEAEALPQAPCRNIKSCGRGLGAEAEYTRAALAGAEGARLGLEEAGKCAPCARLGRGRDKSRADGVSPAPLNMKLAELGPRSATPTASRTPQPPRCLIRGHV